MPNDISYKGEFTIVLVNAKNITNNLPESVSVDTTDQGKIKIFVKQGRAWNLAQAGFMFLLELGAKLNEEKRFSWSNRFIIEIIDKDGKFIWKNPSS